LADHECTSNRQVRMLKRPPGQAQGLPKQFQLPVVVRKIRFQVDFCSGSD
jgi:hypothetical protein